LLPYCNNLTKFNIPKLKDIDSLIYIDTYLRKKFNERLYEAINIYNPNSFVIKVSTGCIHTCAYCAVKISRGRVRSKPLPQIKEEFQKGLAEGFKEFSIIGTDLGSYGKDIGTDLVELLQQLIALKGDHQIRLRNLHPKFLIDKMDELKSIFQTGKISYLESAAQSGNNRILKLMNRSYTIEDYKIAIKTLNEQFPDIKIRTQLMVGFPGETDEEFQDTLNLIDEICFDLVEVYRFEPRPGTKADSMNNFIPVRVARKRYYKLFRKSMLNQRERKEKAVNEYIEKYQ
jgi:MiaB/RimO family radical SAM methylthiotransferase